MIGLIKVVLGENLAFWFDSDLFSAFFFSSSSGDNECVELSCIYVFPPLLNLLITLLWCNLCYFCF